MDWLDKEKNNSRIIAVSAQRWNILLIHDINIVVGYKIQRSETVSKLSSGVYVYSLIIDGQLSETKKMMLIK